MILVVDVGNTRIKGAVFEEDILLEQFVFLKTDLHKSIQNILEKYKKTSYLIIFSVREIYEQL